MKKQKKYYLIYQITNNLNHKIYIGKHVTNKLDDDYFGSGIRLQKAIKKYGPENFTKTILIVLYNEDEMNLLEKMVVNENFLKRDDVYNLCEGGQGGDTWSCTNRKHTDTTRKLISVRVNQHLIESGEEGHIIRSNAQKKVWQKLHADPEKMKQVSHNRSEGVKRALRNRPKKLKDSHKNAISLAVKAHYDKVGRKTVLKPRRPYKSKNATGKTIWVSNDLEDHKIYECDLQWYLDNGYHTGRNITLQYVKPYTKEAQDNCSGKGKVIVCNLKLKQNKRIYPNELQTYLDNGWKRGYLNKQ